jgi:hypothetical protein
VSAGSTRTSEEETVDGNEHPRGALLFILVFLLLVTAFWINTYLRLWMR